MIAISGDQRGPNLRISAEKRGFLVPVRSLGISGRKGKKPRNLKDCRALKLAGWTGLERKSPIEAKSRVVADLVDC